MVTGRSRNNVNSPGQLLGPREQTYFAHLTEVFLATYPTKRNKSSPHGAAIRQSKTIDASIVLTGHKLNAMVTGLSRCDDEWPNVPRSLREQTYLAHLMGKLEATNPTTHTHTHYTHVMLR